MYKPPKREDPASLLKVKLPIAAGMPPASVIQAQLDECQQKKGMQIEQAWTTSKAGQKFVLMAQLTEGAKTPVWTLYEEGDSGKMHWSQPFEVNDFEMMYNVICMSAPDAGASMGIPDALKPHAKDEKKGVAKPAPAARSATGMPAAQSGGYPSPAGASAYPSPAGGSSYPAPAAGSGYPSPAGGGGGHQAPAAGSGYPAPAGGGGYPAPAASGAYQAAAAPPANYPPQNYQQQPPQQYAAPPQPAPYPPGYPPYPGGQPPAQAPYQQPYPGNPQPWQQGYPPQPGYPGQAPPAPLNSSTSSYAPSASYSAQFEQTGGRSSMADYALLTHNANILLGELIFEAGLITEPALEAALKVQEFVREERMSPTQACEILKKHHGLGASIDNYLTPEDFDIESGNTKTAKKPLGTKGPTVSAVKPAGSGAGAAKAGAKGNEPELPKAEKIKLQLASFDLLQKAGLLKNDDLQSAHSVYKKHGGDIVQMLTAAGKMDATTYKAAEACIPLIHDNKMKVEQCIIALNYCQRSRVDFDSALDELGWENPRKA
jgi:hypothetical protein